MQDVALTAVDKILLADIDSFSSRDATYWKSNQTIATECGCAQSTIKRSVKKLIDLGYVQLVSFDGRTRHLRSTLSNVPPQTAEDRTPDVPDSAPQMAQIAPQVKQPITPLSTQAPELVFGDLDTQDFRVAWQQWKDYKKAEHRFKFKSIVTEQVALKKIQDDAQGVEHVAIEAIRNSIANGWKGIYLNRSQSSHRDRQSDARKTSEWAGR